MFKSIKDKIKSQRKRQDKQITKKRVKKEE